MCLIFTHRNKRERERLYLHQPEVGSLQNLEICISSVRPYLKNPIKSTLLELFGQICIIRSFRDCSKLLTLEVEVLNIIYFMVSPLNFPPFQLYRNCTLCGRVCPLLVGNSPISTTISQYVHLLIYVCIIGKQCTIHIKYISWIYLNNPMQQSWL